MRGWPSARWPSRTHASCSASSARRARSASTFAGSIGWAAAGPAADGARDGAPFLEGHPYARDLDLFGPASLFELLNTTRTEIGELTLADWLRAPAPLPEVRARQAAVDELRPMLDFKEDVAVLASESPVGRTGARRVKSGQHRSAGASSRPGRVRSDPR